MIPSREEAEQALALSNVSFDVFDVVRMGLDLLGARGRGELMTADEWRNTFNEGRTSTYVHTEFSFSQELGEGWCGSLLPLLVEGEPGIYGVTRLRDFEDEDST